LNNPRVYIYIYIYIKWRWPLWTETRCNNPHILITKTPELWSMDFFCIFVNLSWLAGWCAIGKLESKGLMKISALLRHFNTHMFAIWFLNYSCLLFASPSLHDTTESRLFCISPNSLSPRLLLKQYDSLTASSISGNIHYSCVQMW